MHLPLLHIVQVSCRARRAPTSGRDWSGLACVWPEWGAVGIVSRNPLAFGAARVRTGYDKPCSYKKQEEV